MAARKPDSEVGPLGVWAYETARLLGPLDTKNAPTFRPGRFVALVLASLGAGLFVFYMVILTTDPRAASVPGHDYRIYHEATLRLLAGGPWYLPEQTTGLPYTMQVGHVMYPPVVLPWLIPATLLPVGLWFIVPVLVVTGVVLHHKPSPWGWVGIAACLAYPPTSQMIVSANPALWIGAFVAVGTTWRPAFALVLMKPSLAPLALFGIRDRGWWVMVAAGAAVSIVLLPLTLEWAGVIVNGRGPFSGLVPVARDVGWVLIPLIAWWSSPALHAKRRMNVGR